MAERRHDYDWIVVGSGFGGSVSALRLAERGYRVAVLEWGRRFADADYARTTWNWRRFLWMPKLGLRGILRLTLFKDVTILSGCGVGGGSPVYANALYRPPERFFRDVQWADMDDWQEALEPHYDTAERMLGAAAIPGDDRGDEVLRAVAEEWGVGDTHVKPNVGVVFGEPGVTVPTRTSAARARRAPAASIAARAWSAAGRARRTRWSRTTSGWPSGAAWRSSRTAW